MITNLLPVAITLMVALYLSVGLFLLGRKKPGYSHVRCTISELGESGSVTMSRVAWALFLPVGLAMAGLAWMVQDQQATLLLAGSLAVGYTLAALFPVDPDVPFPGSWRNVMHTLAAIISYVMAIEAFELLGEQHGMPWSAGRGLIAVFLISIFIPGIRECRGLLQRIVEVAIFAGLFMVLI